MARAGRKPDPNAPTPQRLAKGDVVSYTPRDFGDSKRGELAPQHRVKSSPEPLRDVKSLSSGEIDAGLLFGRVWLRKVAEVGAIDYEASRGGQGSGGLSHAKCEAYAQWAPLWRCLADTDDGRNYRANALLQIAALGRTVDEIAGKGGRRRTAFVHLLISCCQRLVREIERQRDARSDG